MRCLLPVALLALLHAALGHACDSERTRRYTPRCQRGTRSWRLSARRWELPGVWLSLGFTVGVQDCVRGGQILRKGSAQTLNPKPQIFAPRTCCPAFTADSRVERRAGTAGSFSSPSFLPRTGRAGWLCAAVRRCCPDSMILSERSISWFRLMSASR